MEQVKEVQDNNVVIDTTIENLTVDSSDWTTMSTKQLHDQLAVLKERRATLIQLGKVAWMKPLDIGIQQLDLVIQEKTKIMLSTRKIRPNTAIL